MLLIQLIDNCISSIFYIYQQKKLLQFNTNTLITS